MSVPWELLERPQARTRAGKALRRVLGARMSVVRWDAQSRLSYALRHGESKRRLAELHNQYAGRRCFIIGNGPSLNETPLDLLRDEQTFGLNRIYLIFERLGFRTSFLVCMNHLVLEQSGAELGVIPVPKFVGVSGERYAARDSGDLTYLRSTSAPKFSRDPVREGIWGGGTVTYVALQLAYWFGFSEAVLVGVDHNFATKGPAHQVVTSDGPDPNHFDPNYFGAGYRWQLPDLRTSEVAYAAAREAFEADGRMVLDATVGGKLTIFQKTDLADLF